MKICILPVASTFQPHRQRTSYPRHNKDYGVEQDFLKFLLNNKKQLVVDDPGTADWHYLPVFWTRWFVNRNYATTGLDALQAEVGRYIVDDKKTFTICQYDDGPVVDLGQSKIFLASRKTAAGIDIPLLCSPHKIPRVKPSKKFLASFLGALGNHPLRKEMVEQLARREGQLYFYQHHKRKGFIARKVFILKQEIEEYVEFLKITPDHPKAIYIFAGHKHTPFFVRKMLESYIALCPRGYGGSSFRLFEAMQLAVVPFLIGDHDTRPFKRFVNWDDISLFAQSAAEVNEKLDAYSEHDLALMGKKAAEIWRNQLTYQQWCPYVLKELECLN